MNPVPETDLTEQYRALLEVSESIALHRDLSALFHDLAGRLHRVVHFDYLNLILHNPERNTMRLHVLETDQPVDVELAQETAVDESPSGWVWKTQQPYVIDDIASETRYPAVLAMLRTAGVCSGCILPLTTAQRRVGALGFGSIRPHAYHEGDLEFMRRVAAQVAVAVDNTLNYRQIEELKDKLAKEKLYLEDEIRTEYNFEEIVGESAALKRVLREVETVAPTDSTVIVRGESGTGKELIARAIHDLSGRRERTFVKVNCAAIPTGLLESELFGHEKGAFTGAIAQRTGRFELADGGTLFLDEIGDIPLELQPKLLRVLQEHEFERLGSNRTLRVNVRLVTASNRDLIQMVAAREFREDLFYRINVFPILLPPLRDRREDIPLLVRYFAQRFSRRMNKRILHIPAAAMETLTAWDWPGNVRELENLVERAVIVSRGEELEVPVAELRPASAVPAFAGENLQDAERDHILRVLRETGWVLAGPHGAAVRLGLKRSTLQSRMRKLGISRPAG